MNISDEMSIRVETDRLSSSSPLLLSPSDLSPSTDMLIPLSMRDEMGRTSSFFITAKYLFIHCLKSITACVYGKNKQNVCISDVRWEGRFRSPCGVLSGYSIRLESHSLSSRFVYSSKSFLESLIELL